MLILLISNTQRKHGIQVFKADTVTLSVYMSEDANKEPSASDIEREIEAMQQLIGNESSTSANDEEALIVDVEAEKPSRKRSRKNDGSTKKEKKHKHSKDKKDESEVKSRKRKEVIQRAAWLKRFNKQKTICVNTNIPPKVYYYRPFFMLGHTINEAGSFFYQQRRIVPAMMICQENFYNSTIEIHKQMHDIIQDPNRSSDQVDEECRDKILSIAKAWNENFGALFDCRNNKRFGGPSRGGFSGLFYRVHRSYPCAFNIHMMPDPETNENEAERTLEWIKKITEIPMRSIVISREVLDFLNDILFINLAQNKGKLYSETTEKWSEPKLKQIGKENIIHIMFATEIPKEWARDFGFSCTFDLQKQKTETGETVVQDKVGLKFYIMRDNFRQFTLDGSAFIITDSTNAKRRIMGVIYYKTNGDEIKDFACGRFFSSECHNIEKSLQFRKLVLDAINNLFNGGETFMNSMGKICGECCYCGLKLTDEVSKMRGSGPVCERYARKIREARLAKINKHLIH